MLEKSHLSDEARSAPPRAPALIESLRGVGYTTEAAIADLVDNSISASSTTVWVNFHWDGARSVITLLDDGTGLTDEELFAAMQLGSRDPRSERTPADLGRFGLGMKTASFSQSRMLTVMTKQEGHTAAFRWDLDYVADVAKDWKILCGPARGSEHLAAALEQVPHGTLVVWEKLDRLVGSTATNDRRAHDAFLGVIERVAFHLSMVFHRFLDGNAPPLRILVNGVDEANRLRPWDPFMSGHPATIRRPASHFGAGETFAEIQAFVLPHRDKLSDKEFELAAGNDGWTAHQGFYVYRNRRMLVPGSWLGLASGGRTWTQDEIYKLARIRLDISNASDFAWDIDIKKSRARPPEALKSRLRAVAIDARETARSIFAHRGRFGNQQADTNLRNVWVTRRSGESIKYLVDREHPVTARALEFSGDGRTAVEQMLRLLEETVPVQRIWLDMTSDAQEVASGPTASKQEMEAVISGLWGYLRNTVGLDREQARLRLLSTEPFNAQPDLVNEMILRLEPKGT